MIICILTGKLQPTNCGISDYVCLLAQELKKNGHSVFIKEILCHKKLKNEELDLPEATLYSFQFAPYLYSYTGISGKVIIELAKSLKDKKVHFNFHEIWVGSYKSAPLSEKVKGWFQKKEICKILKIINPYSITTTNSAAIDRLNNADISANYLYLFGNIPFHKTSKLKNNNVLQVAIFGSIYDNFPINKAIFILKEISKLNHKSIEIVLIGKQRFNYSLDEFLKTFSKYKIPIKKTGVISTELISEQFQLCDIGISTTPYDIIGKSGATAAMLEHGLPILAHDDYDTPANKILVKEEFRDQIFIVNENPCPRVILNKIKNKNKKFFNGSSFTASCLLEML